MSKLTEQEKKTIQIEEKWAERELIDRHAITLELGAIPDYELPAVRAFLGIILENERLGNLGAPIEQFIVGVVKGWMFSRHRGVGLTLAEIEEELADAKGNFSNGLDVARAFTALYAGDIPLPVAAAA